MKLSRFLICDKCVFASLIVIDMFCNLLIISGFVVLLILFYNIAQIGLQKRLFWLAKGALLQANMGYIA